MGLLVRRKITRVKLGMKLGISLKATLGWLSSGSSTPPQKKKKEDDKQQKEERETQEKERTRYIPPLKSERKANRPPNAGRASFVDERRGGLRGHLGAAALGGGGGQELGAPGLSAGLHPAPWFGRGVGRRWSALVAALVAALVGVGRRWSALVGVGRGVGRRWSALVGGGFEGKRGEA